MISTGVNNLQLNDDDDEIIMDVNNLPLFFSLVLNQKRADCYSQRGPCDRIRQGLPFQPRQLV